ncbi:hypothetical protein V6N13_115412 [Hibiscus sabdariffa]
MAGCKLQMMLALCSFIMLATLPPIHGWGTDGHSIICKIAQSRLNDAAADAVKELLPKWAEDDLGSVCSWADQVRFRFRWSSPLHFINTPEICSYKYTKDKGGNTIDVHWYKRKAVLHHVWDTDIIETAEKRFYDSNIDSMVDAIQQNITSEWADEVKRWETCGLNKTACPDQYASEGIKAACDWAYKGVQQESVLEDDYFLSRLPIVHRRLAQGGVRLAATLNRIFG